MFNNNKSKLDVLQSKVDIYENLSHQMIEKIDSTVEKISDSNQKIFNILTKHDERIDQSIKNDNLLLQIISELKSENKIDHEKTSFRIEKLEIKLEDVIKIKWIAIGCGIILGIFITAFSTLVSGWWTPNQFNTIIKTEQNKLTGK